MSGLTQPLDQPKIGIQVSSLLALQLVHSLPTRQMGLVRRRLVFGGRSVQAVWSREVGDKN